MGVEAGAEGGRGARSAPGVAVGTGFATARAGAARTPLGGATGGEGAGVPPGVFEMADSGAGATGGPPSCATRRSSCSTRCDAEIASSRSVVVSRAWAK